MDNCRPSLDSILEDTLRVSAHLPRFFPSQWGQAGQYEFRLLRPSEAHELKAELGLPDNAPAGIVTLETPFGRKGYAYKVFITYELLDDVPVPQGAGLAAVSPVSIVIWWRRLYCHGNTAYLEARGDYRKDPTPISLYRLEEVRTREARRALDGLHLFKRIERRGRSPDIEDEATFWQLYWDAYQQVFASGRRPTKTDVAAEMLLSVRTLKRTRDKYNLSWPPLPPH